MLSKAIALKKIAVEESSSPFTLPPMEESEITANSICIAGVRTRLEPIPLSPSSPKPVVTECVNCQAKFYSRYPSSMHISSSCSKDCYTSYSWNLKKPSHHQLQEAEEAYWRSVHASNQDLVGQSEGILEEEEKEKQEKEELRLSTRNLKTFWSEKTLDTEDTFSTNRDLNSSDSDYFQYRSELTDMPCGRIRLEPLTAANVDLLSDESDSVMASFTERDRPINPHTVSFNAEDLYQTKSPSPLKPSASFSGSFSGAGAGAGVGMPPVKNTKRGNNKLKSEGYFRNLLNKFVV